MNLDFFDEYNQKDQAVYKVQTAIQNALKIIFKHSDKFLESRQPSSSSPLTYLQSYPSSQPLLIALAYSGGLDSSVLLDALASLFLQKNKHQQLIAFHIHHGLSPFANQWQMHCMQCAAQLAVPLKVQKVQICTETKGKGLEAAAREARYQALDHLCKHYRVGVLFTAHHADDQVETVLFRLFRGAGILGATGIPYLQKSSSPYLIARPFLNLSRQDLYIYAKQKSLAWVEDESNQNLRFTRAIVRHKLLPVIDHYLPQARQALQRFTQHAGAAQRLIEVLAQQDLQKARCTNNRVLYDVFALSLKILLEFDYDRLSNLVRYWLRILQMPMPSQACLAQIIAQISHAIHNSGAKMIYARHQLQVYRDAVWWVPLLKKNPASTFSTGKEKNKRTEYEPILSFLWQQKEPQAFKWQLPFNAYWQGYFLFQPISEKGEGNEKGIPQSLLNEQILTARMRKGGEIFQSDKKRPRKKLKQCFQEAKIPEAYRQVPIVYLGEQILYIPFLGIHCQFLHDNCSAQEVLWHIDWYSS